MKTFYQKHKVKIVMLSPLVLGLVFFVYSAIFGFFAIRSSKVPKDFKKVSLKISDYEIKQVGSGSNQNSWTLKSKSALASSDENKATIIEPQLTLYEAGREKFTISSKQAYLNKLEQEVLLVNGVELLTADGKYTINAGSLNFHENDKFLKLARGWTLRGSDKSVISGQQGLINKSFDSITSIDDAKLTKLDGKKMITISAEKIELASNSDTSIVATDSAVLDIDAKQKLYAAVIKIKKDGHIFADTNVRVVTKNMLCQSQHLKIIPISGSDKNPKTAIFTGAPNITQNNHTIHSDLITYDFATEAAKIEGHVHSAL